MRPRVVERRRTPGDRGRGADPPLRRFRRRRPCELPHRPRRDLRLPRLERLRQVDDDEDADRPAAGERRHGEAVRQADGRRRHGGAPQCRLHVAGVLALQRADGPAESRRSMRSSTICRPAEIPGRIDELLERYRPRDRCRRNGPTACRSASSSGCSSPSRCCTGRPC